MIKTVSKLTFTALLGVGLMGCLGESGATASLNTQIGPPNITNEEVRDAVFYFFDAYSPGEDGVRYRNLPISGYTEDGRIISNFAAGDTELIYEPGSKVTSIVLTPNALNDAAHILKRDSLVNMFKSLAGYKSKLVWVDYPNAVFDDNSFVSVPSSAGCSGVEKSYKFDIKFSPDEGTASELPVLKGLAELCVGALKDVAFGYYFNVGVTDFQKIGS